MTYHIAYAYVHVDSGHTRIAKTVQEYDEPPTLKDLHETEQSIQRRDSSTIRQVSIISFQPMPKD
jgi:hypothetical protein